MLAAVLLFARRELSPREVTPREASQRDLPQRESAAVRPRASAGPVDGGPETPAHRPPPVAGGRGPAPTDALPAEAAAAFARHAAASGPRWRVTSRVLEHSDQPHLVERSAAIAARLRAIDDLSASQRDELLMAERQLSVFLAQRYAGFEPVTDPVAAVADEIAAWDAARDGTGAWQDVAPER